MSNTVSIRFFGQLVDIVKADHLTMNDIADTDDLVKKITSLYPGLKNIQYRLAVNKKIITGNVQLKNEAAIALLPPFSGG